MANNILYVCIVSLPNISLTFLFEMLVSLKVPRALRKLSFCECVVFASRQSSQFLLLFHANSTLFMNTSEDK